MTTSIWHEDDAFWTTMAPHMFDEARWANTPAEVDQLIELAALTPDMAVLDLCCGPGRHTLELARRGFQVTGVDRTARYLHQARETAREEDLSVTLIQDDVRRFSRPNSFDVALSLFTSFGYFENPAENQQALANAYRSLRDGGKFVMELMGKEILARIFQERGWQEKDGVIFLEERRIKNDWRWIENRWIMIDEQGRREFELSHWLYSAAELVDMLEKSDFRSADVYGGLDGSPYDHKARRLTLVAHK